MKSVQTLIVDDEPLARDSAVRLLRQVPGVEVCGQCGEGEAALAYIRKHRPDLVLLDVQMPRLNGIDMLARLTTGERPAVVFMTAHNQFAVRAFTLHAVDYVLKPYDDERFLQAVGRGVAVARSRHEGLIDGKIETLIQHFARPNAAGNLPVVFKAGGDRHFFRPDDIIWIEGEGDYVRVHAQGQVLLVRETMYQLLERLPASRFARVHKSSIVNLTHVRSMHSIYSGDHTLELSDGTRLRVSRVYRERLLQLGGLPV